MSGTGKWGPCLGAVPPAQRNCASPDDNDCDGERDNTIDAICQCSAATNCTVGSCAGTSACTNGMKGPCENNGRELPSACECIPGQSATCSSLGAGPCGEATCAGNFTWNKGACAQTAHYCADFDHDGHGSPSNATNACSQPPNYVTDCSDCNDANASQFIGSACGATSSVIGNFQCSPGGRGSSCTCNSPTSTCTETTPTWQCGPNAFGDTKEHDTDQCPVGSRVTCSGCQYVDGQSGGTCTVTVNADQRSCHLHQGTSGGVTQKTYLHVTCTYDP